MAEGYLDPKYVARRRAALAGMRNVPEGTGLRTQVLEQNPYYGMHLPLFAPASPGLVPTIASNPGVGMAQEALAGLSMKKPKALQEAEAFGAGINPPINMNAGLESTASTVGNALAQVPGALPEGLKIVPGISGEMIARDLGYTLRGGPLDHMAKTVGAAEGAFMDAGAGLLDELKASPIGQAFLEGWRGPVPSFEGVAGGASTQPMTPSEAEIAQAQAAAQQRDLAGSVGGGGLGGGGVSMPTGGGVGGNLYGLEEPKPLPRPDFSRIEELLSQMQPEAPEKTSREDMLLAVLGGLAQGSLAGNTAGSALAGAGAGGIGARDQMLQRERFDQKEFEKETREFFMTQAQQEMNELQMNGQLDLVDAKARQDFVNTRAQILQSQAALQAQIQMHNSAQAGANARARLAASTKGGFEGFKGNVPFGPNGTSIPFQVAMALDPEGTIRNLRNTISGNPETAALAQRVNTLLGSNELAQRQLMSDPKARTFVDKHIGNLAFMLSQNGWDGRTITPEVDAFIQNYFNAIYPPME